MKKKKICQEFTWEVRHKCHYAVLSQLHNNFFCLFLAADFVRNERHQRFPSCHDAAESGGVGALAGGSGGGWWRENQGL